MLDKHLSLRHSHSLSHLFVPLVILWFQGLTHTSIYSTTELQFQLNNFLKVANLKSCQRINKSDSNYGTRRWIQIWGPIHLKDTPLISLPPTQLKVLNRKEVNICISIVFKVVAKSFRELANKPAALLFHFPSFVQSSNPLRPSDWLLFLYRLYIIGSFPGHN